jgi:hypothetical protein
MAQSWRSHLNDGNRHLGLPSPSNKIFFCRQGSLTGAVEGSSFSGLLTHVDMGHIRVGSAGYGRIKSSGSGFI